MSENLDIISIGESLIELSSSTSLHYCDCLTKYYGGDALTTAMAALKVGSKVGYISSVGNDYFKDFLMESWKESGLDVSHVKVRDGINGMYLIALVGDNKKEITYYRKKTAASKLSIEDISEENIKNAKYLYSTGITQSVSLSSKEAVKKAFKIAKENGVITAYDPNYHQLLMNEEEAKEFIDEIIPYVDIIFLNNKEDGQKVLEMESHEKVIKYFWDLGVNLVVVKSKEHEGFFTGYNGDIVFTKYFTHEPVDSTCAGDAFNGGFLHALSKGLTPVEATLFASVVAGLQSKDIGAIKSIPNKEDVYKCFNEVTNS